MEKIDPRQSLKELYAPSAKDVTEVVVPPLRFLMIDGDGGPDNAAYREAVESLFALAYGVKFAVKRQASVDFRVMPLECLWWADDYSVFLTGDRESWRWTAMIMQPEPVTAELVEQVREQVAAKKKLPALDQVRFETFEEGRAAQILYVGPYADEGPTIQRLHQFIADRGGALTGKHHEIYLNDPSRTAPEKLKTILRQPFV